MSYSLRSLWVRRTTTWRWRHRAVVFVLSASRMLVGHASNESSALGLDDSPAGAAFSLATPLLDLASVNFASGQEIAFHFTPTLEILLVSVAVGALVGGWLNKHLHSASVSVDV